MTRRWVGPKGIVARANEIAKSYTTAVTLRQLHYRLVAEAAATGSGYENNQGCYKQLSSTTAEARRAGDFTALSDTTRGVDQATGYDSPEEAIADLAVWYRRNRTEGQKFQVWVLYEKATLGAQIRAWTDHYGLPTAALRGYSSESLEREIFDAMIEDGRPAVVFYIGDLDPEGEDIERNFIAQAMRMGVRFHYWQRLTILLAQATSLAMNFNPGKKDSSRAKKFIAKYGPAPGTTDVPIQIEAEALDPARLQRLVTNAIKAKKWFDKAKLDASLLQEKADIKYLESLTV